MSMQSGIALGSCMSLLTTLLSSLVIAKLLDTQMLVWENVGYGIMIALLVASFWGAFYASRRIKRQYLLVCLTTGAVYFGALLSMTALLFDGQFHGVGVTALLILSGCMVAFFLNLEKGKRRGMKRRI